MEEKEISVRLLYRKIDNTLSAKDAEVFDAWIKEAGHQEYFENIKRYYEMQEQRPVLESELNDAWEDMHKRIQCRIHVRIRKRINRMITAAAVIVLIGFGWLVTLQFEDTSAITDVVQIRPGYRSAILELASGKIYELKDLALQKGGVIGENVVVDSCRLDYRRDELGSDAVTVLSYNKLIVPRGGEFQLCLEDGTKVWLNSASQLKYPERFSKDSREVYLEGEAYFEVTKDSLRPFSVYCGMQKVTVLGTSFGMTCYPDESVQSTTLVKGRVRVELMGHPDKTFLLKPGMQAIYGRDSRQVLVKDVNVDEAVAWHCGKYVFTQRRLEDLLATLSRWYDFEVFYQNNEVKDILFSGEIKRFEDFNYMLRLIEKTSDVKFIVNKNIVRVMK